jgi:hypothetical protein
MGFFKSLVHGLEHAVTNLRHPIDNIIKPSFRTIVQTVTHPLKAVKTFVKHPIRNLLKVVTAPIGAIIGDRGHLNNAALSHAAPIAALNRPPSVMSTELAHMPPHAGQPSAQIGHGAGGIKQHHVAPHHKSFKRQHQGGIVGFFKSAVSTVESGVKTAFETVKGGAEKVWGWAKNVPVAGKVFQGAESLVKGTVGFVENFAKHPLETAENVLTSNVTKVANFAGGLLGKVWKGLGLPDFGNIEMVLLIALAVWAASLVLR